MEDTALRRRARAPELRKEVDSPRPPKTTFFPRLLNIEDVPAWSQEAPHIRRYYRPITYSSYECFKSLLYLHNETINIYSHLIPALVCLGVELVLDQLFLARYPRATIMDRLVFSFQLFAIIVCFAFSAFYHTFLCHSAQMARLWEKIDYCGIMTLIFASFVSGIYVGLNCETTMQVVYWTMIGLLTIVTAFIVLNPSLQTPKHRTLRLCSFTATGCSGFGPVLHIAAIFPSDRVLQTGVLYYLAEGAIFFLAALVYGVQFPESKAPGKFDLFGASHQIFHVLVVLGAAVHVAGLKSAFEQNYAQMRC